MYLLKSIAIQIGEVFNLKFFDQVLIGFRQKQSPQGAIRINFEYFILQPLFDQFFNGFLSNYVLLIKTSNNHRFLLSFGSFNVEQSMDLINVVVHRFLVIERMQVQIKLKSVYQCFWLYQFRVEEINENLRICNDFIIQYLGTDDQPIEQILNFTLEVFLLDFFDFMQRYFFPRLKELTWHFAKFNRFILTSIPLSHILADI